MKKKIGRPLKFNTETTTVSARVPKKKAKVLSKLIKKQLDEWAKN